MYVPKNQLAPAESTFAAPFSLPLRIFRFSVPLSMLSSSAPLGERGRERDVCSRMGAFGLFLFLFLFFIHTYMYLTLQPAHLDAPRPNMPHFVVAGGCYIWIFFFSKNLILYFYFYFYFFFFIFPSLDPFASLFKLWDHLGGSDILASGNSGFLENYARNQPGVE
jgi:hypothetical protein